MIAFFVGFLQRLLQFAVDLAASLIRGILGAPFEAMRRLHVEVRRGTADEVVPLRHEVLRPGKPRESAVFEGDDKARHWVATSDSRVVGVVTVVESPMDGVRWQLRGMAVDPKWRGHGVGRKLLERVVAEVGEPMWCNARVSAEAFYAKNGWRSVGQVFDKPGIGPHIRMTRD